MPYAPAEQSIFKSLTSINAYKLQIGTIGDTLTTGPIAKGDLTVPITALTNFTDKDPVFINGSGGLELLEIDGTPDLDMPIRRAAIIPQDAGARFVEARLLPLGHIAEDSASFGGANSSTPIPAATSSVAIGYFVAGGTLTGKFGLLGFNSRTLAITFGQDEAEIGTGTATDPYQNLVNGTSIGSNGLLVFRASGVLQDGSFVEVDMIDVTISGTVDISISGKKVNPLSVSFNCVSHIIRNWK